VGAALPQTSVVASPGNNQVRLSWSAPSSDRGSALKKFKVYRATTPGGESLDRPPLATLSNSTLTFTDTTATNGSTWYYVVVATNGVGTSDPSAERSATPSGSTTATVPGAPTSVAASNPAGRIHLQWNPPASDGGATVTAYRVFRGAARGGEDLANPVATVSTTSYDDEVGLTAGTTYYYVVKAVNSVGAGPSSAEVSATLGAGKPGPAVLSGQLVAGPAAALTWTLPADGGSPITKYVVLRDAVRLVTLTATPGGPTSYTDSRPPSGTHVYQVKAVNAVGSGQLSNKVTLTVP